MKTIRTIWSVSIRYLMIVLAVFMCLIQSVKAEKTNFTMYFDNIGSGFNPSNIWLSWQKGSLGSGNIFYGGSNVGSTYVGGSAVNWSGANNMSDPVSLASVFNGSGGLNVNSLGGFFITNAPSMNLYISYGGSVSNNLFTTAGLLTAPALGSIDNNNFAAQSVEISHVAGPSNFYSGGDLTAINFLSTELGIRQYAAGETNPANTLQSAGWYTPASNVFSSQIAPVIGYTAGDLWNEAVAVDQNGNPLRLIPPNSLPAGQIGPWPSWSNYLAAINQAGNVSVMSNQFGLFYYGQYAGTDTNVQVVYQFNATVGASNNMIFNGSLTFSNVVSGTPTLMTNFTGLSITNFGSNSVLQASAIYNQINTTNTALNGGWSQVYNFMYSNQIVQGGTVTNGATTMAQLASNSFDITQQDPVGDYTTALGLGLINSPVTNSQFPSQSQGSLSSYQWFYQNNGANQPKGLTNGTYFLAAQPGTSNYNSYIQSILDGTSNTVYSIPYGDRVPSNNVLLSTVANGTNDVGSWVITLGGTIGGNTAPSWANPTNILSGTRLSTNAIFYVGNGSNSNLLLLRGGAGLAITNDVGGVASVIGSGGSSNIAIVAGTVSGNSAWTNNGTLYIGSNGNYNTLMLSSTVAGLGGTVYASNIVIGANAGDLGNRLVITGDASLVHARTTGLYNTNVIDIRGGSLVQNGGTVHADVVLVTNNNGSYQFNGGTALVNYMTVNNGQAFQVGNGTSVAYMQAAYGLGTNNFANGLVINSNANYQFAGWINTGAVTIMNGGTFGGAGLYYGGDVNVSNGATINAGILNGPQSLSPGNLQIFNSDMNWYGGGADNVLLKSFTSNGTGMNGPFIGVDYNAIFLNGGSLNINANAADRFVINLNSVFTNNTLGLASTFTNTDTYQFQIIQLNGPGSINGFDTNYFRIITTNFLNTMAANGSWSLFTSNGAGSGLWLQYSTNGFLPEAAYTNVVTSLQITNTPYVLGNDNLGSDLLLISNGGSFIITNAPGGSIHSVVVGNDAGTSNNLAIVTGAGSVWSNTQTVTIGRNSTDNSMIVSNGGSFYANQLVLGANAGSAGNSIGLHGSGSQMIVTNAGGTGSYDVRRGTVTQNDGTLRANSLVMTNAAGTYNFNGGSGYVNQVNANNGSAFTIGNGAGTTAYFRQTQAGVTNTFANGVTVNSDGVFSFAGVITNNITLNGGTLKGTGTLTTALTVDSGDTLSPGNSPGTQNF
ncbi:MAG: hypothetical protein SFY92_10895, partial [Verrucomicrobiae bacterium]|nr:hypothetical protein [Verrucomicrobiae bacterium]